MHFYCIECLADTLPLLNRNNNQFDLTTQGVNYPDEVNVDEIFLNTTQANKAIDNGFDFNGDKTDLDTENEIHPIDCKYYTLEEFNEKHFNSAKHFSILHLNIHSLQLHIEELRIVLKLINLKFDFICITESKIRKHSEPKIDITIDDYQIPVGIPTEATRGGGVLIYAKEGIDFIPREDLIIYKTKELESYFI